MVKSSIYISQKFFKCHVSHTGMAVIGISLMIEYFTIDWNNIFLKENIMWFIVYKSLFVSPFLANVLFLHPQKPSRNLQFSEVFKVYSNRNG